MKSVKLSGIGLFVAMSVAVLSNFGCVVDAGTLPAGNTAFVITNQSGENVCFVNLSPTSSANWGPDQLGPSEVIQSGYQRSWTIPADYYDFRLQDCNRQTMMERRNVPISGTGVEITFRTRE